MSTKIQSDVLKVDYSLRSADGTKLEPEEQQVTRQVVSDMNVRLGSGPAPEAEASHFGKMKTTFSDVSTTNDALKFIQYQCMNCKYYDNPKWQQEFDWMLSSKDPAVVQIANNLVSTVMEQDRCTRDAAVRSIKSSSGVCHAITNVLKSFNLTEFEAMTAVPGNIECLTSTPPVASRNIPPIRIDRFFTPRSEEIAKEIASRREALLRLSQGKPK